MAAPVERPEDLHGVELADFVSERNALAARLKSSGDTEGAAAVKAMRKPPRSVWALNVVAREQPDLVARVLHAAGEVVTALGEGGDQLRAAQSAYSGAVTAIVDAAEARAGVSGDARERMRATVLAAGADPDGDVAEALRVGTLAADVAAPGFSFAGLVPGATTSAPASPAVRTPAAESGDTAVSEQAAAEQAAATAAAERAAAEQAEARAAERRRARERQQVRQQIGRLEQRAARLSDVADAAEAAAVEARAAVVRAQDELRDAQRRLEELDHPGE